PAERQGGQPMTENTAETTPRFADPAANMLADRIDVIQRLVSDYAKAGDHDNGTKRFLRDLVLAMGGDIMLDENSGELFQHAAGPGGADRPTGVHGGVLGRRGGRGEGQRQHGPTGGLRRRGEGWSLLPRRLFAPPRPARLVREAPVFERHRGRPGPVPGVRIPVRARRRLARRRHGVLADLRPRRAVPVRGVPPGAEPGRRRVMANFEAKLDPGFQRVANNLLPALEPAVPMHVWQLRDY